MRSLLMATRRVYHRQFIDSGLALNEHTLGFLPAHALRLISEDLTNWAGQGHVYFNNVSLAPRNPANIANKWQQKTIEFFQNNPEASEQLIAIAPHEEETNWQRSFQYSTPIYVEQYCLKCHGNKVAAPAEIQKEYSTSFDMQPGQLYGILSIRIDAEQLLTSMESRQRNNSNMIMASSLGALVFLMLIYLRVISPRLKILRSISRQHQQNDHNIRAHDELDEVIHSFNNMSDEIISQEKALLASNEFSATILNNISDAVAVIDPHTHKIIAVNPAFLQLHHLQIADVVNKSCQEATGCQSFKTEDGELCPGKRAIVTGEECHGQQNSQNGEQSLVLDVGATPIKQPSGEITQLICVARDITASFQQQQQIQHMAYHDFLTGLPNRELFKDRLEQALVLSSRKRTGGFIAFIDLDKFKHVNDTFGHDCGDELLKVVARRLLASVRESDTVARMSGDEFLIIYHEVTNDKQAIALANGLLSRLNKPMMLSVTEVTISASIGLCSFPKHGTAVDELLKCADSAMYEAKRAGRNKIYLADDCTSA